MYKSILKEYFAAPAAGTIHYTSVRFTHTYVASHRTQKRKRSGRFLFVWGHQKEKIFKKSDNKKLCICLYQTTIK